MPDTRIPRVLVLGATGRVGAAVVRELEATRGVVAPVRASRSAATVQRWIDEGKDAAYAASTLIWARQTYQGRDGARGRFDYAAVTTSTVEDPLGRDPVHLDAWAAAHRQELLGQLS
ncbi:hypothetical protein AB5J52_46335 [Streptomyces sp. R39]|uniref:NAD-dependent epimerase/dehydratase family protein n=1 Tax=Streptomyces sp. R39 TaxID=3238631 RepID=A0AB39R7Y3_9ACTN